MFEEAVACEGHLNAFELKNLWVYSNRWRIDEKFSTQIESEPRAPWLGEREGQAMLLAVAELASWPGSGRAASEIKG
ncbi:hypothetical protein EVAR_50622_1 [Eumeta japonica]|uniref:Uncharacterized protein n=1 Tax=Eumeta variegata TaxID=151549 RepID=A0A4C1XHZ9_EUMVA|nr:hypothetical protein EVAR_50622_1 [Eumeta japonica]